jgi:PAS domain S-box-containing protein
MTPFEWPLRVIPRRNPPLWESALITFGVFAGAMLIRGLLLGFDNAWGLSATYFPAFILTTLYAGPLWGWGTFVLVMLGGVFGNTLVASTISREGVIVQFGLSGGATVLVAAALRETLLRLEEAKVTEEKAQADIVATEARFRTLADSAPVLMWVSKLDGGREFANRAYVDFVSTDYETALDLEWRDLVHPDDLDRIAEEERRTLASGGDFIWEARYRSRNNDYRWIRSISQRRFGPDGAHIGYIGVGYDITEAKQAQADLTRINDLLAERVDAALTERDQAEAALHQAQKLEAVGQLTGGVAHDFNNLLTVIIGAMDLMQRHPQDEARRDRMIEAAQGAARRGERLTQQLLAFSRRQALKPQRICIDDLLNESEPLLRRAVGEAVNLTVAPGAPGAVANIDPSQFDAAMMNLVVNARDATPPSGRIRVESLVCALAAGEADGVETGDYLCVSVHDTGEGMDPDVAARVFEPFFTTKEPGRGTGLGLSQVYGFARQSGGAAVVETTRGKGSTIRIYLPLQPSSGERPEAAPDPAEITTGPSRRVLLVEDEVSVGDMVEAMLADLGHQVVRAAAAPEALTILRSPGRVDLLLTDLIMPGGKTGVELAHEAATIRPGLPVILTSGYTGEALGEAADAPWPLLRKPYTSDTLASLIEAAMRRAPETV